MFERIRANYLLLTSILFVGQHEAKNYYGSLAQTMWE